MKTARKVLLLVLCAALLVSATVMGTLAYLTDTDNVVKNTFSVGNVTITLDEAKVDEYGVEDAEAARVIANTYKLIPGHEYVKDPEVHVQTGSENCYIFVKVENGISEIEATGEASIASQMAAKGWAVVSGNVYIYKGNAEGATKQAVAANTTLPVFDTFKLADNADLSKVTPGADGTAITINAYAIQADGFDDATPAEIWAAVGVN